MDKIDIFVKLIPLRNSDNKRVLRTKNHPLQRIKVTSTTSLSQIRMYMHSLVFKDDIVPYQTHLYSTVDGNEIRIPLTLNVAEYLIITHQNEQGEIRYTFSDNNAKPIVRNPFVSVIDSNVNKEKQRIQNIEPPPKPVPNPISFDRTNSNTGYGTNPDSLSTMFTLGLSFFNDSLGFMPLMDSQSSHNQQNNNKTPCPEAISLRNELEMLIQKK